MRDVVREHHIAVRAVTKKSDDSGMLALGDLHDASFGAAIVAAAQNAREDAIAMHGVSHVSGRMKRSPSTPGMGSSGTTKP